MLYVHVSFIFFDSRPLFGQTHEFYVQFGISSNSRQQIESESCEQREYQSALWMPDEEEGAPNRWYPNTWLLSLRSHSNRKLPCFFHSALFEWKPIRILFSPAFLCFIARLVDSRAVLLVFYLLLLRWKWKITSFSDLKSFSLSFATGNTWTLLLAKEIRPECRMEFVMLPYLSLGVPFTWAVGSALFPFLLHAVQNTEKRKKTRRKY